jgi:hypothetical protein
MLPSCKQPLPFCMHTRLPSTSSYLLKTNLFTALPNNLGVVLIYECWEVRLSDLPKVTRNILVAQLGPKCAQDFLILLLSQQASLPFLMTAFKQILLLRATST